MKKSILLLGLLSLGLAGQLNAQKEPVHYGRISRMLRRTGYVSKNMFTFHDKALALSSWAMVAASVVDVKTTKDEFARCRQFGINNTWGHANCVEAGFNPLRGTDPPTAVFLISDLSFTLLEITTASAMKDSNTRLKYAWWTIPLNDMADHAHAAYDNTRLYTNTANCVNGLYPHQLCGGGTY